MTRGILAIVFLAATAAVVLWAIGEACHDALRSCRRAARVIAEEAAGPPAPGKPSPAGHAVPTHAADPAPGHIDARLLGRCVATVNYHEHGASVVYDHRTLTRTVNLPVLTEDDIRDLLDGEAAP